MMRVLLLATALATLAPIAAQAGDITVTGYGLSDRGRYRRPAESRMAFGAQI